MSKRSSITYDCNYPEVDITRCLLRLSALVKVVEVVTSDAGSRTFCLLGLWLGGSGLAPEAGGLSSPARVFRLVLRAGLAVD